MLNSKIKDEVFKLASRIDGISDGNAKWISGLGKNPNGKLNESSNGACVRLGLLSPNARGDSKQKKIKDYIVENFLREASTKEWYSEWKDWLLSNRVHKVDGTKLPPYSGESLAPETHTPEKEPSCYQPTVADWDQTLALLSEDSEDSEKVKIVKIVKIDDVFNQIEIENEKEEDRDTLCPSWREILTEELKQRG